MGSAPIVVHPPSPTGGRRVTAHGAILGLAYSDQDVIEFLRRAGLPDAEDLLDDPRPGSHGRMATRTTMKLPDAPLGFHADGAPIGPSGWRAAGPVVKTAPAESPDPEPTTPPATTFTPSTQPGRHPDATKVDFGTVKLEETCPAKDAGDDVAAAGSGSPRRSTISS